MPSKHYTYGPSSTDRWLQCPGSIALSKGIAYKSSIYADEGTKAHAIAEAALLSGTDAVAEDSETRRAVQMYIDEIRSVVALHDVIVRHTERTLEHAAIKNFGGTTDHLMIYRDGEKVVLHVFDYKHGVGVPVDVEENKQVLSYFAIIESHFPGMIDLFRATIVQPRCFAGDEIQTWECDVDRVRRHEQDVRAAIGRTELKAGDHCRWCKAATVCPKLAEHAMEVAEMEFDVIRDNRESLAKLFELSPAIKSLLGKIEGAMMEHFRNGNGGVPGYKVVAKRESNRKWIYDDKQMVEVLEGLGVDRKIVVVESIKTPPQLEKELPDKKIIAPLTKRNPTGFKVVPITARGAHVDLSTVTEFEPIIEEEENEY